MSKVESYVPRYVTVVILSLGAGLASGCDDLFGGSAAEDPTATAETEVEAPEPAAEPVPEPEPVLEEPVPLWEDGAISGDVDAANADEEGHLLLDLGDAWTPYLFSEVDRQTGERVPNDYRGTYLALARGEFPDDHHGDRARRDKYLELYGILPTLDVLRTRLREASELECAADLDLQPLVDFDGFVAYRNNDRARRDAREFRRYERRVEELVEGQGVADESELDVGELGDRDRYRLRKYREERPAFEAVLAAQKRLECEGYYEDRGDYTEGALDWATHEALAEFERRHRVYGWGFVGRDTIEKLRLSPTEVEREAVLRILTERAMHAAGVIEDGSRSFIREGEPRTYTGADGEDHPVPNLEASLRDRLVEAFGLQTPESTLEWLEALGELPDTDSRVVAVPHIELPEYYEEHMELEAVIDRGDVWYEFPYDAEGNERAQPVQRRPRLTIFTNYRGQRIPLARFGTTIGGWRSELVEDTVMWKYKVSEIGPRVWRNIVASPVWLPPETTPARDLVRRNPRRSRSGERNYVVNYHETGPSYASAYGLVAAYHQRFRQLPDGTLAVGGDEGIRTHGSVDYMSIMRRHSHGCHRLHNHIAVRLMSFVLRRRPHHRRGQQTMAFRRELEVGDESYQLAIDRGGYVFELDEPLRVNVLEGRIRGSRRTPVPHAIPKYNEEAGAYLMPDGTPVRVDRMGNLTPYVVADAGPDAGSADAGPPAVAAPLNGASNGTLTNILQR